MSVYPAFHSLLLLRYFYLDFDRQCIVKINFCTNIELARDPRIVQSFKSKDKEAQVYFKITVQVVREYFEYLITRKIYFILLFVCTVKDHGRRHSVKRTTQARIVSLCCCDNKGRFPFGGKYNVIDFFRSLYFVLQ